MRFNIFSEQNQELLILMVSTQASFALIVEILFKYYPGLQLIQDHSFKPEVHLSTSTSTSTKVEIRLARTLFDLDREKDIGKIYSSLHIDFNLLFSTPGQSSSSSSPDNNNHRQPMSFISWKENKEPYGSFNLPSF